MDTLYQELLEADADSYLALEKQIVAEWEKSGSAAMDLLVRRGKEALEDGTPEVAVEHFSAAVDHAPEFAEAYYGRALSFYRLGHTGPALADIQEVLRLNPKHFEAMTGLASIMMELERPDDALEIFQYVLDISPQSQSAKEAVTRLQIELEGQAL